MTRILQIVCLSLLCGLAARGAAEAHAGRGPDVFARAFGKCGATCVIRYNPGGEVRVFLAAARAVRAGAKRLVVIDGPCISACAIFADQARSKVCITGRASFGFHKARQFAVHSLGNGKARYREMGRSDPPHSADIARWVKQNGGFPYEGLRVMSARQATKFWRRC